METLEAIDFKKLQEDFPFVYDVLVIGGGVSGLSTAIEAADKGLSVVIIEETGVLSVLEVVSRFRELGLLSQSDVFSKSRVEYLLKDKNIHVMYSKVVSVFELSSRVKKICTQNGIMLAKTVVFATGITFRKRETPNVHLDLAIDPMMDIVYYMGKNLAVLGNNIHAFRIAEYFSPLVRKVHLVLETEVAEVSAETSERLYSLANVSVSNERFFDLVGEEQIEKILLTNGEVLDVDCVFDCSLSVANTFFIEEELLYKDNYLQVNEDMETAIPGVYAVGSCRINSNSMSVSAINDAHLAVRAIERYLLVY